MSEPKYINADDAVKHLEEMTDPVRRGTDRFNVNWIINFLEAFPAEPVALTSRWVEVNIPSSDPLEEKRTGYLYVCKRCLTLQLKKSKFCPECGAKMETEVQE